MNNKETKDYVRKYAFNENTSFNIIFLNINLP